MTQLWTRWRRSRRISSGFSRAWATRCTRASWIRRRMRSSSYALRRTGFEDHLRPGRTGCGRRSRSCATRWIRRARSYWAARRDSRSWRRKQRPLKPGWRRRSCGSVCRCWRRSLRACGRRCRGWCRRRSCLRRRRRQRSTDSTQRASKRSGASERRFRWYRRPRWTRLRRRSTA